MEPEFISQQTRPRFARKYGRSYQYFGQLSSASLGSRHMGKVRVDCRFRLSESQWGTINKSSPAGILYVDLNFDQPQDCRLKSAAVLVTLEKEEPLDSDTKPQSLNHNTLQLTDYYGPKHINGEPTVLPTKRVYQFMPEANAMGCSGGGVGIQNEQTTNEVRRWAFTGQLMPGKSPSSAVAYRTLKWELTENEFDSQSFHSNVIRTGFAFEHDREVFRIRVEINGKLQKRTRQLKEAWKDKTRHFRFPPEAKQDQGSAVTLVDVRQTKQFKRQLDSLAIGLPDEMIKRNQLDVPVEVPNSMPSLFQELPSVFNPPPPDFKLQAPDNNGNSHAQLNSTVSPSAQDLISASQIIGTQNQQTSSISHPSPSSSATLVAESSSEGGQRSQAKLISSAAAPTKTAIATSNQPVGPDSHQPPLSPFLVILRMLEAMIVGLILRLEPSSPQKLLENNSDHNKQTVSTSYPDFQFASQSRERPKEGR